MALVVHVEALLDVAGDGSTIPDEALAEAAGCCTSAIEKHRARLRAVFEISADRGKTPGRPMYRYRRREWDESRGVAYLAAQVLTDPEFTATDVAVLLARASWSDYQGRINPGGSLRAVARRARVSHPSVTARPGSQPPGPAGSHQPCPPPMLQTPPPKPNPYVFTT